jgi:UDP-N-acetylmuramoyl-tripeptide--D-alanyl-D-alanine ligase
MGDAARRAGIARLWCAGPNSREAAKAFGAGGEWRETVEELAGAVGAAVRDGVTVLVKGSRSMGMERVVQALAADGGAAGG